MKKLTLLSIILFIFATTFSKAQTKPKPELKPSDLEKYTYYFDIKDGKIVGEGADFLKKEIAKSQYFLLGEYHNSYRISEFTKALIPVLHDEDYRYFGLEIGPISNRILTELSKNSAKTRENLRRFNSEYYVKTRTRNLTPIPFFGNVSDADFLSEATKRNWKLIGLDQEFSYSYLPLINRMYENLSKKKKRELKETHSKVVEVIKTAYEARLKTGKRHYQAISGAKDYQDFLKSASQNNPKNKAIADALRKTTEIYLNNVNRKYFKANDSRINYMKENLRKGFAEKNFNLKTDKMFLKMGGVHTGKGFGSLSLYEVGNTLHELANFNGSQSLHSTFYSRYYQDKNGKIIDRLENPKSYAYNFKSLLQVAKSDKWTIIDLRPMRSDVFYSATYNLNIFVVSVFKLHDIIIIPKYETDITKNFDLREK